MDNEALMRRISAATDAKKAKQQAHTGNPAAANPSRNAAPTAAAVQSAHPNGQRSATLSPPPPARQMPPQRQTIAPAQVPPTASAAPNTVARPAAHPQAPTPSRAASQGAAPSTMAPAAPAAAGEQALPSIYSSAAQEIHGSAISSTLEEVGAAAAATSSTASLGVNSAADSSHPDQMSFMPPKAERMPAEEQAPRPQRSEERGQAYVVSCSGTTAIVQGDSDCVDTVTGLTWAVGRMLSIQVGANRIVGMICDIEMLGETYASGTKSMMRFHVELQGEVQDTAQGEMKFTKGISAYPGVGSIVHQIRSVDLAAIYAATGAVNAFVGELSQDNTIPALVDIPDMLSKHFAVLGSTGCGKSASVSLLLHAAQEMIPDLRTIILDPHNEYSRAFPHANTITHGNMDIPFWMFQLEEYVEVLFRGKPIVHEEVDALREFIPEAKIKFRDGEDRVKLRPDSGSAVMTADTAAPYRIADLLAEIEEEMGLLESQYDRTILKSLRARINAHCSDSRYAFMFRHRTIEDIAQSVIGDFFSLPGDGSNSTIIQMAGMPAEVVNAVASVLCRLSFELAIAAKGNLKVLVVCEEAHRYVPAGKDGFEPTRRAIARIAKEGRKYGSFMAIVSQRPSELDPTILSQCSTVFSLRLTNDFDQDIIRRAISSSSASTIAFISSLSNRECIAFGEGMSTPMRMRFRNLPPHWLPGAEADVFGNSNPVVNGQQAGVVYQQWRNGLD